LRKAFIWKAEGVKNEEIIDRLRVMGVVASSSGTAPENKKGTSYLIDYLSLSAERLGLEPIQ